MSGYKIRLYQQRDAEDMHAAALESVAEVHPWMAWCHEGYALHEARQWIAVQEELARQGMAYEFAILDHVARFLGGCGINQTAVQRCAVHKVRNLERKAPKHALAEIRDDFQSIVYATSADAARIAYARFERTWPKRCPGVVRSLREGADELLTFFTFPRAQRNLAGA